MRTGYTVVLKGGEEIGRVLANHSMTVEDICELCDIELAITQEDFENLDTNGKHDLDELEFVEE